LKFYILSSILYFYPSFPILTEIVWSKEFLHVSMWSTMIVAYQKLVGSIINKYIIRLICISSEEWLLPLSCLSICPHYQCGCHWLDFCEVCWWGHLSVGQLQISLNLDNNIWHFTWRSKFIYILGSGMKYFVVHQPSLAFS